MLMNRYTKNGKFFSGSILMTDESTIFNPTDEQMIAAGWEVYVEPEPTDEQKLWNRKQELTWAIQEYDRSTNVNQFTIGEDTMWLDHNTREQLKTSIEAYKATGAETATKWFNNKAYTFPVDTWLGMLARLEVYAGDAKNVTDAHLATVANATTLEELANFDHTAGYPEKLVF